MKTIRLLMIAICLTTCLTKVGQATPLGTAFTYQGRLADANSPADGLYDFRFKLYDQDTGFNQFGNTVTKDEVDVIDGYFTVRLDFVNDPNVFDGSARWLEIGVRPGELEDPNTYTALTPRQGLTPTPYALQAKSVTVPLILSADVPDLTAVLNISSTGDGVAIVGFGKNGDIGVLGMSDTGVYGESGTGLAGRFDGDVNVNGDLAVGGAVNATVFTGDGSGLTNLPTGITVETDPTVPANLKDGVDWLEVTSRPAGLDDGDDVGITVETDPKIGANTTNYLPRWNGSVLETGSIFDDGNIGIGTTSPLSKLSVGGIGIADAGIGGQGTRYGVYGYGSDSTGWGVYGIGSSAGVFGVDTESGFWGALGYDTFGGYFAGDGYFSGNVGIGTAIPSAKLDVVGDIEISGTVDGVDISSHAANATAHHAVPTSLPPSGLAGGDLSGSYPNPQVLDDSHNHANAALLAMITSLEARIAELESPLGWSVAKLIETDNVGNADLPQIAIDPSGNAVAVWSQDDGTRGNIWSNRYVAGTGWGTAELIEADNAGYANSPQVAMDGNGNAVAVWHQSDGTRYNIWSNRYVAGAGWGTAELIETEDVSDAEYPQVAKDSSGNAIAVWQQYDGTRYNIWSNRYVAGTGWSAAELIETDDAGNAINPQVAIDGSGNAIAVWRQFNGTRYNVWSNRYVASTGLWSGPVVVETDDGFAGITQVAVNSTGNAVVVWQQYDGTRHNIWSNRYVPGTGWGIEELIENDNAGNVDSAQVAIDTSGNAIAVWKQYDGTRNNIWSNRYVSGTGWGTAELIETNNAGSALSPQVAVDGSGNAVAVWQQYDGTRYNIWSNRYYVAGTVWGTAELIETDNAGNANSPQVAFDGSGNALAVWTQHDGTRNNILSNYYTNE